VFPNASPRRVVRIGFLALFASTVILIALLDLGAGPEIITWPMLLAGLGVGALASQLGSVTHSVHLRRRPAHSTRGCRGARCHC
jgi:threonine/homoserine efflux transporter RhtA